MSILKINNLQVSFKVKKENLEAIRNVDIDVNENEILGIVGESGSGKSITVKSIMSILPSNANVDNGEIIFNDIDILNMDIKEKRKILGNDITMIFQDPMTALNPLRTIGYHLTEIIMRHQKVDKTKAKELAIKSLEMVDIPNASERFKQFPHEFSGGMRQRVIIAMALVNNPKLLIADEPTTALDVTIQAQILSLIKRQQQQHNMSVVLITHDLAVVYNVCDRIVVMYGGKIMESGTKDEIFNNAKHPYTKALLKSIPDIESDTKEKLLPIDGVAPSLQDMPKGCPFAPRCSYSKDICTSLPTVTKYSDTHTVYCHLESGEHNE